MEKAAPCARAEVTAPGPIFAHVGDAGLVNDIDDADWLIEIRQGDTRLLVDMPPQQGREREAHRLFDALANDDPTALANSDFRFAGCFGTPDRVIMFRDPLGTRPLHYRFDDETIRLASMPQDLRNSGDRLDWRWLARRAAMQFRTDEKTAWQAIKRVPPGCLMRCDVRSRAVETVRYWMPGCDAQHRPFADIVAETRALTEAAVRRAVAGKQPPIAMQLTGGLDSSLVLMSVPDPAKLVAFTGKPSGPLTAIPGDDFLDDAERAAVSARQEGVEHVVVTASPDGLLESMAGWNRALGEPVPNGDNLSWLEPLYDAAAQRGAKVLLTGAFGNFTTSWPGSGVLAEARRKGLRPWLEAMRAHRRHTGANWKGMLALSFPTFHRMWRRDTQAGTPFVVGRDGRWSLPVDRRKVREQIVFGHDPGPWNEAVRRRHGLDEVDIFADRQLVEFCLTLDEAACSHGGQPRALGRALLRGRLPDRLVDEPARGVQGADWAARIAREKDRLLALVDTAIARAPFNQDRLAKCIRTFDPANAGQFETTNRFDLLRAIAALEFSRWGE